MNKYQEYKQHVAAVQEFKEQFLIDVAEFIEKRYAHLIEKGYRVITYLKEDNEILTVSWCVVYAECVVTLYGIARASEFYHSQRIIVEHEEKQ